MEAIIDGRAPGRLAVPGVQGGNGRGALGLDGEIDNSGGAAKGRRAGAGFESVGSGGAAKRHLMMGMGIDAAGDNQLTVGIYDMICIDLQIAADQ